MLSHVTRPAAILLAGALTGPALPRVAPAQTIRGVLRGIGRELDRAARPDSAAGRSRSGTGVASGGALRIVEQRMEGSDSLAQRFALDTGLTVMRPAGACGVARACVAGWDLRVTRVALPGPLVPAGAQIVVTAEVENRGRQPAPPSELRVCFADNFVFSTGGAACGRQMLDAVAVPALAPGARAVVRHAVELPTKDREVERWAIAAEIDPDSTLAERDRTNNAARSTETASRLPTLQLLTADVPGEGRAGTALPVTVRVRNTSTVATSAPTDLQLEGYAACNPGPMTNWGGGPYRLAVPALAPRQSVVYRLLVPDAARCRASRASMSLRLDPDRRGRWGQGHEHDLHRSYSIR